MNSHATRDRYCVRLFTRCCHDDSPLTQTPPLTTMSLLVVVCRFAKWKRGSSFKRCRFTNISSKGERELNKYAKRRSIVILHWLCPIRLFPLIGVSQNIILVLTQALCLTVSVKRESSSPSYLFDFLTVFNKIHIFTS